MHYRPGDWVVYRKTKVSSTPGPRAARIIPSSSGEDYTYLVDKYWVVDAVHKDGSLVLVTRRGKQHVVRPDDPNLRRATLWERLRHRERFAAVAASLA